jgi:polysaccharide pyruvyl transferase WcaK-like protein
LCSGGYLTDLWSLDLIMQPLELAGQLKLPISTAPIGIGPFKSVSGADRVGNALSQVQLKVRDQVSLDFCRARGLKAVLEPDDAFALDWLSAGMEKSRGHGPRKIGVCIFPQYGQEANLDLSGWWTQVLRGLRRQHPQHEIEGFCFHTSPHAEFREMVRLFLRTGLPPGQVLAPRLDFRQAAAGIREYDFIISTRFHAVVVANVLNIPNIAIANGDYYLAKMQAAVCRHETLSTLINPVCSSPETLLATCQRALTQPARGPGKSVAI